MKRCSGRVYQRLPTTLTQAGCGGQRAKPSQCMSKHNACKLEQIIDRLSCILKFTNTAARSVIKVYFSCRNRTVIDTMSSRFSARLGRKMT